MTILNDRQITEYARTGMISPFVPSLVRKLDYPVISYGLSSFGYDLRLSPNDFQVFRHIPGTVIDPKNFNPDNLEPVKLHADSTGQYFILPGHSYGLGVAVERVKIPPDVTTICMGKSTYARAGIIANITPGEAGWEGHFTLEFSNSSCADCKLYANEGIVQLLFLQGASRCDISYADRNGKYQSQHEKVTLAKV